MLQNENATSEERIVIVVSWLIASLVTFTFSMISVMLWIGLDDGRVMWAAAVSWVFALISFGNLRIASGHDDGPQAQ